MLQKVGIAHFSIIRHIQEWRKYNGHISAIRKRTVEPDIVKIGCPKATTRNNWPALDFIEFFHRRSPRIIEIVGPLYLKGLSITDIHKQTGIPRSSIYASLRANRHVLRPQGAVPFERWRKGHGKTRNKPPYGWCFSQGELVKDHREYPMVQLIESLWKQGRTVGEIVRYLNGNGYRSRLNRDWGYGVVRGVISRLRVGGI